MDNTFHIGIVFLIFFLFCSSFTFGARGLECLGILEDSGDYFLSGDVFADDRGCVTIYGDNVNLFCNGSSILSSSHDSLGINVINSTNVSIYGCNIETSQGIYIYNSQDVRVFNISLDSSEFAINVFDSVVYVNNSLIVGNVLLDGSKDIVFDNVSFYRSNFDIVRDACSSIYVVNSFYNDYEFLFSNRRVEYENLDDIGKIVLCDASGSRIVNVSFENLSMPIEVIGSDGVFIGDVDFVGTELFSIGIDNSKDLILEGNSFKNSAPVRFVLSERNVVRNNFFDSKFSFEFVDSHSNWVYGNFFEEAIFDKSFVRDNYLFYEYERGIFVGNYWRSFICDELSVVGGVFYVCDEPYIIGHNVIDGYPLVNLDDIDADFVLDDEDSFIGKPNFDYDFLVDSSFDFNDSIQGLHNVSFQKNGSRFIEYLMNFSYSEIVFNDVDIEEFADENLSKVRFLGLGINESVNRTLFFEFVNDSKYGWFCVKQEDVLSFDEISVNCSSFDEVLIMNNSFESMNLSAFLVNDSSNSILKFVGLFSAVTQMCKEDWNYSSWSECSRNRVQVRFANDLNLCGTTYLLEEVTKSCTYHGGGGGHKKNSVELDVVEPVVEFKPIVEPIIEFESVVELVDESGSDVSDNVEDSNSEIIDINEDTISFTDNGNLALVSNVDEIIEDDTFSSQSNSVGFVTANAPTILGFAVALLVVGLVMFFTMRKEED